MSDNQTNPSEKKREIGRAVTPVPEATGEGQRRPGNPLIERIPSPESANLTFFQKLIWTILAIVCGIWIVLPEPTDVIPFFGWIDEFLAATGLAAILFVTSMRKLGIHIPIVDKWVHDRFRRKKGI